MCQGVGSRRMCFWQCFGPTYCLLHVQQKRIFVVAGWVLYMVYHRLACNTCKQRERYCLVLLNKHSCGERWLCQIIETRGVVAIYYQSSGRRTTWSEGEILIDSRVRGSFCENWLTPTYNIEVQCMGTDEQCKVSQWVIYDRGPNNATWSGGWILKHVLLRQCRPGVIKQISSVHRKASTTSCCMACLDNYPLFGGNHGNSSA